MTSPKLKARIQRLERQILIDDGDTADDQQLACRLQAARERLARDRRLEDEVDHNGAEGT